MFEQALFQHIQDNFAVSGFDLSFGFGTVEEDTQAPYVIQYSLDTNGDSQFLCNENDFSDGEAFIQWNIYITNPSNGFYIKTELMKFIGQLKKIEFDGKTYMIQLNNHSSSPSGIDDNTGLFIEVVARELTYNIGV